MEDSTTIGFFTRQDERMKKKETEEKSKNKF